MGANDVEHWAPVEAKEIDSKFVIERDILIGMDDLNIEGGEWYSVCVERFSDILWRVVLTLFSTPCGRAF